MKTAAILLLTFTFAGCAAHSTNAWFLPRDCSGSEFAVSVVFDERQILGSRGPACEGYRDNIDGKWQKQTLSADFKPNHVITWTGYREESFDSPADAVLKVDLWLAGADRDPKIWFIGVYVSDEQTIYFHTIHVADLTSKSETCIAPGFCIETVAK